MARLKKLVSYSVHDAVPTVLATVPGKANWLVKVSARNQEEEIVVELENIQKTDLMSLYNMAYQHLTEAIADLSPIVDGGFTVYQKIK